MENEDLRQEIERLMYTHWDTTSIPFYFSQVLSGECTIQDTIDDLKSFERSKVNESK